MSILCILSIPALIQPSSATAVSTSWRRASTYPGLERRRYNTFVNVFLRLVAYEEIDVTHKRSCRIAANFTRSKLCARPSRDRFTPLASLISISFCTSALILTIDIEGSGLENRLAVSTFPDFLHYRKAFLDHGPDEFHFLLGL